MFEFVVCIVEPRTEDAADDVGSALPVVDAVGKDKLFVVVWGVKELLAPSWVDWVEPPREKLGVVLFVVKLKPLPSPVLVVTVEEDGVPNVKPPVGFPTIKKEN